MIVGRGGQCILREPATTSFHVFVYAPRAERIQRSGARRDAAADLEAAVDEMDRARAAYVRRHFGCDWANRHLYDLMIDSSWATRRPWPRSCARSSRGDPERWRPTAPPQPPAVNPWIVAMAVMSGTFMEVLDTTVVNVSLPHIAGNLSATVDEATWALTSYLVANAIVLPITGWLANYFGRKRLLMLSVTGFTVRLVPLRPGAEPAVLILFRIIQGATGGALQPLSQAVMLEAFPPEERGKAMAFWGLGIVVAPDARSGARAAG